QVSHAAQRSSHVRWRYLRWHVASLLRLWTSGAFWRYSALLRKEARETRARAV
ncbi:MAG: glycosyl transferase, partial [Thiomonas sp. 20-64-5]